MSRTYRNERHLPYEVCPGKPWQENRGPRHGNNRKMYARLKWKERKANRMQEKTDEMIRD